LRGARARLGLASAPARPGSYPRHHVQAHPAAEPAGPWPEPPVIESPAAALHPNPPGPNGAAPEEPWRAFDVELFTALNDEYASHPIVPHALQYDMASVVERGRRRLLAIHREIDLRGKTVLEVGCGSGIEAWYLAHHFDSDAWGVDVRPRRAWPVLSGDRVHLLDADISGDNGLEDGFFDRVVSNTVWEHIHRPHAALETVYRVLKPGGLAWIRANLYRGPTASHRYRDIYFPFPHLLFSDDVIAEGLRRAGKTAQGAAWVNRLTWEQYETHIREIGFAIRALRFDLNPLDEPFYARFEDVLGRYPRRDLERGFFTVVLEKPARA
jgi:SAM-dependent methyltransferase